MALCTIISGGARGTDQYAEQFARDEGFDVVVLIAPCDKRAFRIKPLSRQELWKAEPFAEEASMRLNKSIRKDVSKQLIYRNYHIVDRAETVIATGSFDDTTQLVEGGTGWGVEFAKMLKKPLFLNDVNDVDVNHWLEYNHEDKCFKKTAHGVIPYFYPSTAVIGTRDIEPYPIAIQRLQQAFIRNGEHLRESISDEDGEDLHSAQLSDLPREG